MHIKGSNNSVKLKLIKTKPNGSAFAARVLCTAGKHRQIDEVHFGVAQATQADIRIHWPVGSFKPYPAIAANRIHRITEGSGRKV